MAKDIIIGGASNYSWDNLKYWINSIAKSGFDGDVILIATNIEKETIDILSKRGVKLSDETKNKLSQLNTGKNNPNYGLTRSEKTKKKISLANSFFKFLLKK